MNEIISQETMAELVKLGGQYALPIAALLRALYAGMRGRLPEGFAQIIAASVFAGLTALVGNEQLDLRTIIGEILGNTVFMAGLLSFIVIYLLRQPNRGFWVDGIVGGVIGLIVWFVWVYILQNEWPWWIIPFVIAAGAAGFITLRILMRTLGKLVQIATYFIVIGLVLVLGAGAFMLFQTLFLQSAV
jgi:hypothetical protein